MSSYSQVFDGNTLWPSDVSYLALALSANVTLKWPLETSSGSSVVARIIDVTPTTTSLTITMPPANQTGVGQVVQFKNVGPHTIDVLNNAGGALLTITNGAIWTLYLTGNATVAGVWASFQQGSVTSQAQASSLVGYGLKAISSTLAQAQQVTTFNANYTAGAADRSSTYVWTGGLGTLTMPAAAVVGNNWFMAIRNQGTGNLTVARSGSDTINGATSLVLRPGDSATINTDGTLFYTVGLGQDPVFAFDFTVIDLTSAGATYTLSGAELNRIAYQFIGVQANNVRVNVPATTQQYWVANDTTGGSYTVSVATATQSVPIAVTRGARGIYYCKGTEVVKADTAALATPISVADGGTGATTASGARINLGGTSVGIAVFVAATDAAGRTALGSGATGSTLFTAATAADGRTTLGSGATGSTLFTAATAADGRTTLGAAASGANSDITSLSTLSSITVSGTATAATVVATGAAFVGGASGAKVHVPETTSLGVGINTLASRTTGTENTIVGNLAGAAITTAGSNTALGYRAVANITTTSNNTGVGYNAIYAAGGATGDSNTAVGASALGGGTLSSGSLNVAVGKWAAINLSSGGSNTFIGALSGADVTTGSNNQFFGPDAGRGVTTGSNNVVVGPISGHAAGLARTLIIGANGRQDITNDGTTLNLNLGGVTKLEAVAAGVTLPSGKLTLPGSSSTLALKLVNMLEAVTISATAATGTIAYDITTQSVLYYTTAATATWVVNLRGNGSTTLNSLMATGESVTVTFAVTQGATAYHNTSVQVDGTTTGVTTRWVGGAPSGGTVNSISSYLYRVIKTGSAAFTVIASLSAAT